MWKVLKDLVSSKKAMVAAAGVLTLLAGKVGIDLPPETANQIAGIVIAYVLGQGLADVGKHAIVD
jgi:hypothetical protein